MPREKTIIRPQPVEESGARKELDFILSDDKVKPLVSKFMPLLEKKGLREHSERAAVIALQIATKMGLNSDDRAAVAVAAILHDVGKIKIPQRVLDADTLSDDEWKVLKKHPELGVSLIKTEASSNPKIVLPRNSLKFIKHHHEYYSGGGYPLDVEYERIPLGARIIAVADAYVVMTMGRHYQKAVSPEEAVRDLQKASVKQFDPRVVNVFLGAVDWRSQQRMREQKHLARL